MEMGALGKEDQGRINIISGSGKSIQKINQGDEVENDKRMWQPASKMTSAIIFCVVSSHILKTYVRSCYNPLRTPSARVPCVASRILWKAECDFQGWVIKDMVTSTLLSWITRSVGSQLPHCEDTQGPL